MTAADTSIKLKQMNKHYTDRTVRWQPTQYHFLVMVYNHSFVLKTLDKFCVCYALILSFVFFQQVLLPYWLVQDL